MFRNPSHPRHELELRKYLKPYTCDGCKERGFGARYRCKKCDFDLHKACIFPQISPSFHEFFPGSTLEFFRTHDHCRRLCDACRKVINGYVYHCEKDNLDLHPCCRNLNRSYRIGDVEFQSPRESRREVHGGWKRKSVKHGGDGNGWSYISECGKYHIHVACVTVMALEEWKKSGGDCSNVNGGDQPLALKKVNLTAIEGGRGNGFWRMLKDFIETLASCRSHRYSRLSFKLRWKQFNSVLYFI